MSVNFRPEATGPRAKRAQWAMLRLFLDALAAPRLAAIAQPEAAEGEFDAGIEDVPVTFLNRLPHAGVQRVAEMPLIYARLVHAVRSADYVYARLPSWVGLAAVRVARVLGTPYFLSLHGHWDRVFTTRATNTLSSRAAALQGSYVDAALRAALGHAQHAFFVGDDLTARYGRHVARSTSFANYLHDRSEVWPARPSSPSRKRVLFVGELSRAKGLEPLVEALRLLVRGGMDVELALVGNGPERARLEALEGDTELAGRLLIRGWRRPGTELDEEFRSADVFALPSLSEGVPKVVIEAMVRAVPVVATAVGDVPHLLGSGTRGWVVPVGAPAPLAAAIAEAVTEGTVRSARTDQARDYARTHDRRYATELVRSGLERIEPSLVRPRGT